MMVRDGETTLLKTLRSLRSSADEVVLIDTGSTDRTANIVEDFRKESGLAVRYESGTSPRYCWDCLSEHGVGEMHPGHRFAGFETARNQSIAQARGDWILWIDADETLLHGERLSKYLKPGGFQGFGVPQDHHASDPPQAYKRDIPIRLFRRTPLASTSSPIVAPTTSANTSSSIATTMTCTDAAANPVGFFPFGPHRWPTYGTGLTTRFAGIVHEHPGHAPLYTEGLGPVMILGDVWIAHTGYYTEAMRRARFARNWPLMVADRQKYARPPPRDFPDAPRPGPSIPVWD